MDKSKSEKQKSHVVPKFILKNFKELGMGESKLFVYDVDKGDINRKTHNESKGFYLLGYFHSPINDPPNETEKAIGELESDMAKLVRRVMININDKKSKGIVVSNGGIKFYSPSISSMQKDDDYSMRIYTKKKLKRFTRIKRKKPYSILENSRTILLSTVESISTITSITLIKKKQNRNSFSQFFPKSVIPIPTQRIE